MLLGCFGPPIPGGAPSLAPPLGDDEIRGGLNIDPLPELDGPPELDEIGGGT